MKKYLLAILFYGMFIQLNAQKEFSATIDTNTIQIGEQATIRLSLLVDTSFQINWPAFESEVSPGVELIDQSKIDTTELNDKIRLEQDLLITVFDSGVFEVSPFVAYLNNDSIITNALNIHVGIVDVDTTQPIKDIQDVYQVELTWKDHLTIYWNWFKDNLRWIAPVGIVLMLLIIIILIKVFRKKEVEEEPKVVILPFEWAMNELQLLKEKSLWQKGDYKSYYQELTNIVRSYIEKRFNVSTLERTTEEILLSLKVSELNGTQKAQLEQILMLSDLVKFAKEEPLAEENNAAWDVTFNWLKSTEIVSEEK